MATVAQQQTQPIASVEDYIRANPGADPKSLLEILLQQNTRIREENRQVADVELDANGDFRPKNLAGLWRLGSMYAKSELVPKQYRNKPEDCAIAIQMAIRCKVNIMTFLQASYVVYGRPGIEAKLAIAMLNASGRVRGRIRYRLDRDASGRIVSCTAAVTDSDTGEEVTATVDATMVREEGWDKDKKSESGYVQKSKWNTMPEVMYKYRAAMFLVRQSYPDVLFGMYTTDELDDMAPSVDDYQKDKPATPPRTLDELGEVLASTSKPEATADTTATAGTTEVPETADRPSKPDGEGGDPLSHYAADLRTASKLAEVSAVYDEWFGPNASEIFSPEDNARAVVMRDARKEEIRAAAAASKK